MGESAARASAQAAAATTIAAMATTSQLATLAANGPVSAMPILTARIIGNHGLRKRR